MRKNIFIVTYNQVHNDGALLQSYALKKFIEDKVNNNNIVVRHVKRDVDPTYYLSRGGGKSFIYNMLKFLLMPYFKKNFDAFCSFKNNYIEYTTKNDALSNPSDSVYITGSDQVWNTSNGICEDFFLKEFNGIRVSYAASLGRDKFREDIEGQAFDLLKQFNAISLRESTSVKYITDALGRKVHAVLDPVFLLDDNIWNELVSEPIIKEKYVFLYITEPRNDLKQLVSNIKEKYGCKVYSLHHVPGAKKIPCDGPIQFLNYIKFACSVVGSSFHATAFSVIFQKDFYVLLHSSTGSRVYSMLKEFNMLSCIVEDINDIKPKQINYNSVIPHISEARENSRHWLYDVLKQYVLEE